MHIIVVFKENEKLLVQKAKSGKGGHKLSAIDGPQFAVRCREQGLIYLGEKRVIFHAQIGQRIANDGQTLGRKVLAIFDGVFDESSHSVIMKMLKTGQTLQSVRRVLMMEISIIFHNDLAENVEKFSVIKIKLEKLPHISADGFQI